MYQPTDSFIISIIKNAWSLRWEAYKLHCVQIEGWQDQVREDGRALGMLKSLGKRFFYGDDSSYCEGCEWAKRCERNKLCLKGHDLYKSS